ncbi:MAG TPA: alpha/beta fold hydrolase [Burkholderiales bacterium]|nr:alpha/beta fold hydrolase [Burkholderiales bacterium]
MSAPAERVFVAGDAGRIETVIDFPAASGSGAPRGLALVAHPHPLYGGTLDNKVAQTLARAFVELGYVALRPNFRGVGQSEGAHDEGNGETDDLVKVAQYASGRFGALPVALAGFSFGAFVQTRAAKRLVPERMALVGLAVRRAGTDTVPPDTVLIHGERDDTVPLADVLRWAEPQELPVVVVPGADHFFHRRLHIIRRIVQEAWR